MEVWDSKPECKKRDVGRIMNSVGLYVFFLTQTLGREVGVKRKEAGDVWLYSQCVAGCCSAERFRLGCNMYSRDCGNGCEGADGGLVAEPRVCSLCRME